MIARIRAAESPDPLTALWAVGNALGFLAVGLLLFGR